MGRAFTGWLLLCLTVLAQTPAEHIQNAIRLTREKHYAEARKEIAGVALPSGPQPAIAFHRLKAAIASGLGEHDQAAREMESALELAPANIDLQMATALAQEQAGDLEESRGRYIEAAKAYQRAVELSPLVEQYRLNLALELVRHHTFEPAAVILQQAAALFPRSPRILTLLGVVNYALSKGEDAVAALSAALEQDPKFPPAREYLARFTFDAQTADSRAVAALCQQRDYICAAARLRANRDDEEAFRDLRRLLEPGDNAGRCELARAYEWRSQWALARTEMEACVRWAPGNAQYHYRLARIYQRLGLDDLARREAELQRQTAQAAAEEIERRERAVEAFRWVVKQ